MITNNTWTLDASEEIFDIAEDEQLIGCELSECIYTSFTTGVKEIRFNGVTWLKIKVM